jgi:hypothetical protein
MSTSENAAVTRPGVLLEFGDGQYDFRTYGIEVNVPDDIPEIPVLAYHRRLVSILEKVAHTVMPLIEPHGISRKHTVHERRKAPLITLY